MDEEERRRWLVEQLALEADAYKRNEVKAGDFHLARGNVVLDIAEHFDLISAREKERLHAALLAKDAAAIRNL